MACTVRFAEVWPGVYRAEAPFSQKLNAIFKGDPNDPRAIYWFDYNGELGKKYWYVPQERLPFLGAELAQKHYVVDVVSTPGQKARKLPDDLLHHQDNAVRNALMFGARLLQFDTGCGKTLTALTVADNCNGKTLIVAPRVVIPSWHNEIAKWILLNPATTWEQRPSRRIPEGQPDTVIVTYESLHRIPPHWRYDCMIFDELHYAIHQKSKRSKAICQLSMGNLKAIRLGLTATPTSAETHNIYGVLHALCPHRWGTWKKWTDRFHVVTNDGYEGARVVGPVREDRKEELAELVAQITDVATIDSIGRDKLPPVEWSVNKLRSPNSTTRSKEISKNGWVKEQTELAETRASIVAAHLEGTTLQNTALVCYLHKTAETLGKLLNLPVVTGTTIAHKRTEKLQDSKSVVLTMRSANEGIDLRQYTNVYLVETYPVPRYMEQIIGRFVRLYATEAVCINFLALEGTSDIIICRRLAERLREQRTVNAENTTRSKLLESMEKTQQSDNWIAELNEQLASGQWEDTDDGWD